MRDKLVQIIKHGEGFVPRAYQDTRGFWTFGYGRCFQTYPLTLRERNRVVEVCCMVQDTAKEWTLEQSIFILSNVDKDKAKLVADFFLTDVLDEIENRLRSKPWYEKMNDPRRCAVIDLCYNMGLSTIMGYTNTILSLDKGDFVGLADRMLLWPWAQQVSARKPTKDDPFGGRAYYVTEMIRTGDYPAWVK